MLQSFMIKHLNLLFLYKGFFILVSLSIELTLQVSHLQANPPWALQWSESVDLSSFWCLGLVYLHNESSIDFLINNPLVMSVASIFIINRVY